MKLAISAAGKDRESRLDSRFGRCAYFVVCDTETGEVQAVPNEAGEAGGGAGIKAAQIVVGTGAGALVTGNIGPNALEVLQRAGLKSYVAEGGKVEEIVEAFNSGRLREITDPTTGHHGGLRGSGRGARSR
ncbi:MAG: NifB/NifX family molybdenum-iron cluster-binding protein [Eubacteriales bacterium]|nr:NifB/NifX family molybdenum-iron cluster-binding protein [Bacillota bacterium]MBV1728207.1 NifB/NifX family molybdenum-iron cluster-binding protein [Desulforudis sp.]MDQ7789935.1 NifB/NifX family molybdenum-iron cluster-binding protein [Clostridia bacterium]MDZ4043377.1 NifB/NifX family molybdenum-iron cluster-binding protein [Eubacteriales bacterium]MBU4532357.1 NifB/NifX family molybdenum-iron cluster-binding protein [Bacillota bacterium]